MGRRYPLIMRKASFKTLPTRSMWVCAATPDWRALLSCGVSWRSDSCTIVLALALYLEAANCLSSMTREIRFFAQSHNMVTEQERSVQFYPKISQTELDQRVEFYCCGKLLAHVYPPII